MVRLDWGMTFVFALLAAPVAALARDSAAPLSASQSEFRAIYQELVEIDTTLSADNCTAAAKRWRRG